MNQEINTPQEVKVQSAYIPSNWKKNQDNKGLSYLNWLAYKVKSKHYTNDQRVSDALLTFNN